METVVQWRVLPNRRKWFAQRSGRRAGREFLMLGRPVLRVRVIAPNLRRVFGFRVRFSRPGDGWSCFAVGV